jgi:hypothetical protein
VPAPRPQPSSLKSTPSAAARAVVEQGFIPVRAKLIEVAAFLDRIERHGVADDFRCVALREAAALLVDGAPERARRILEHLSDPSAEPEEKSSGKAALGAWQRPSSTLRKKSAAPAKRPRKK